jgi:hypothetical protein
MTTRWTLAWLVLIAMISSRPSPAAEPLVLTVSAGEFDRRDTVVEVALPEELADGNFNLREDGGKGSPLQSDGRRGVFVLRQLAAGKSKTFTLEPMTASGADPDMQATRDAGALKLSMSGKDVLQYQGGKTPVPAGIEPKYQRGGYIHPVYTPSGKLLTDDYPPNHKHHHGIWSPWTKTEFEGRHPDFWNMGDLTGTVEPAGILKTWSGPVAAGFRARHRFVDLSAKPDPKTALNEQWEVNLYRVGAGEKPYFQFDLVSKQHCATSSPLILPKYYYGGLGFRGNRQWNGAENVTFLSSEGKDRKTGNETRGRWAWVGGKVDGHAIGVAILCAPENFRAPQPMRIHPNEPFFCYAPSQLGDFKIEPGQTYTSRYRFIVTDGDPGKAEIERQYNDYAHPPAASIK